MATPTKGGVLRTFASTLVDRLSGRSATTSLATQTAQADTADSLNRQFAPPGATQYFPAGVPMTPIAPDGSTTGRARDFAPYINQNPQPKSEPGEGIGFRTLRRMASPSDGGLDLLRLAIETRKDQMVAQRFQIRGRKKDDDGGATARKIEKWMRRPDGVHTYRVWLRMLLEDHFVIDAPTIYFAMGFRRGEKRPLLEIVDGATIKCLLTPDDGRVPQPPLPAYQQILKGMPGEDYTIEELGYYAYNLLPYRTYGMSRVEQVIVHVNMAIQRAMSQLDYFTEGTTPDGFVELPKEWTVEQMQQFAEWYNSILAGQSAERRRIQFVPNGANYKPTKDPTLKDLFDEWLARIICFDFSLPPQALVKETNRATAETNKQAAQEEGLEPTKLFVKDTMDDVLERMGVGELEWQWQDEEIVDPEVKAKVAQTYFGGAAGTAAKMITLAEARDFIGFPPASKEQLAELQPPEPTPAVTPGATGSPNAADGAGAPNDGPKKPAEGPTAKAAKHRGGRSLPPLERNTKHSARVRSKLHKLAAGVLSGQRKALVAGLKKRAKKFAKLSDDDVSALIQDVVAEGWDDATREKLWELLSSLSEERAAAALDQLKPYVSDDAYAAALTQANERAVEWARFRASNMITEVDDTTRQLVNELSASAIEDGLSNDQFADQLEESFGFSGDRAEMIARTETAEAETAGTLEGYKASGVVEKKGWSADDEACDVCAELDGEEVGLDETFSDGSDGSPAHPRCECTVYPVLSDDAAALIVEE